MNRSDFSAFRITPARVALGIAAIGQAVVATSDRRPNTDTFLAPDTISPVAPSIFNPVVQSVHQAANGRYTEPDGNLGDDEEFDDLQSEAGQTDFAQLNRESGDTHGSFGNDQDGSVSNGPVPDWGSRTWEVCKFVGACCVLAARFPQIGAVTGWLMRNVSLITTKIIVFLNSRMTQLIPIWGDIDHLENLMTISANNLLEKLPLKIGVSISPASDQSHERIIQTGIIRKIDIDITWIPGNSGVIDRSFDAFKGKIEREVRKVGPLILGNPRIDSNEMGRFMDNFIRVVTRLVADYERANPAR